MQKFDPSISISPTPATICDCGLLHFVELRCVLSDVEGFETKPLDQLKWRGAQRKRTFPSHIRQGSVCKYERIVVANVASALVDVRSGVPPAFVSSRAVDDVSGADDAAQGLRRWRTDAEALLDLVA